MLEDIIIPPKFSEYFFNELEENVLENIITSSKSPEHLFNELEEELTELFDRKRLWIPVVIMKPVRLLIKICIIHAILTKTIVNGIVTFSYQRQKIARIKCIILVDTHNHELNPIQIVHLNVRY
ncbi:hypothetical protein RhiirC2_779133 [Rhizophagus irregularis]|uniref:Uncharacterized protein n=1 Tax=Rhizophagus irregularis TaxID=588596 RepID=A0A2N1NAG1_9GLOM|nr:hypothetical protein RhiirC2_779133 [Rhizophagus irregularis]